MANRCRSGISRREFARRAAMTSAVALLPAAGSPASSTNPSSGWQPQAAQPSPAAQLTPESQAEAEARYQAVLHAYGSRLSEIQKADLHRMSLEAQPALDRIRAYHLENSDTPALYLKPLVEREKKNSAAPAVAGSKKP